MSGEGEFKIYVKRTRQVPDTGFNNAATASSNRLSVLSELISEQIAIINSILLSKKTLEKYYEILGQYDFGENPRSLVTLAVNGDPDALSWSSVD